MDPSASPGGGGVCFAGRRLRADKHYTHGTHRTASPEETLERLRPHMPAVGLTRLADITGLDRVGVPVVLAHRPNAPTLANAAGKGYTLMASTASAAMEAVEVFHAEQVDLPVITCSYDELARERKAIPRELLPLTKRSLFRPGRPEQWVMGWDLLSGEEVALPFASVAVVPAPGRRPSTWMPFAMGTNGLAGGNHLLEAIEAALLEVIERDALACHTLAATRTGVPFRRVRLETVVAPLACDLIGRFTERGIGLALYDCSSPIGVPCYSAVIWDMRLRHLGRHSGFGAHLDPQIAMVRAMTEAAQSRAIYIAGSRDDLFRREQRAHQLFDTDQTVAVLDSIPAEVDVSGLPSLAGETFEADVSLLLEMLRAAGVPQVIALELTRPEIGVPVARIVIPGFEGHMFEHYAPGPRALRFAEEARAAA